MGQRRETTRMLSAYGIYDQHESLVSERLNREIETLPLGYPEGRVAERAA